MSMNNEPGDGRKKKSQLIAELRELRARNAALEKLEDRAGRLESMVREGSDQKRMTAALKESEARYRELVENANSIIIRWDMQGRITFFNEFAEKLFGYSISEILGRNVVGTIVPGSETTGRDLSAMVDDLLHDPERYKANVNENLCKNGERLWIAWTNKAIYDAQGNPVEILSVGNDITERKKTEEAFRKSEERFRSTFEQSAVGMTHVGFDGRFLRVNKKYCEITGYAEEELLELTVSDITFPADVPVEMEYRKKILAGEISTFSSEKRYVRKDGSLIWVRLTVALVRDDGKPAYMAGVTENITERKNAEEALNEAKSQMELYVDLMGHDINNMNQISMGYLELAQNLMSIEGRLETDNANLLEKAIDSLKNSSQLIDNVRKLQREKMGLYEPEMLDVRGVIEESVKQFNGIHGRDVQIFSSAPDNCLVQANALLKDVFTNLVGNAVKHSKGPLTISITAKPAIDGGQKCCRIDVEDNGPGIPDTLKSTLFDRLNLTTTRAKGKGFGLCLIKMLVDDFQGKFWVEDRMPGDHTQGARFVVMLPAVEK